MIKYPENCGTGHCSCVEDSCPNERKIEAMTERQELIDLLRRNASKLSREAADMLEDDCAKQEPIGRISGTYGGRFVVEPINPAMVLPQGMALYAAPVVQQPLTDEELLTLLKSVDYETQRLPIGFRKFARAIEAAHNITGEKK